MLSNTPGEFLHEIIVLDDGSDINRLQTLLTVFYSPIPNSVLGDSNRKWGFHGILGEIEILMSNPVQVS